MLVCFGPNLLLQRSTTYIYIYIRDNAIRESVANKTVSIQHIEGKINLADLFTKKLKDKRAFITMRNHMTSIAPNPVLITHRSEIGGIPTYVGKTPSLSIIYLITKHNLITAIGQ